MNSIEYNSKYQFMSDVLKMLHLTMDNFMYNLAYHNSYEAILYRWINKLYAKGVCADDAVQLIYKARNVLMLNPKNSWCSPPESANAPA
jgi:predicted small integral membrane protein